MARIRLQRVARQMKQIVGRVVSQELRDPRAGFITIVDVDVAADLKTAHVRFSVLGSDAQKRTVHRALDSARGFIQARVAQETGLKYTPIISFVLDESAERDIELLRKIDETVEADRRAAAARTLRARVADGSIPDDVLAAVAEGAGSDEFIESTVELLTDLVAIDTTPRPDPAASERACLQRIDAELKRAWGDEIETELLPVDPAIEDAVEYTRHTDSDAETAYAGRANLVVVLRHGDLSDAPPLDPDDPLPPLRLAFNTHVDTIPPHLAPSRNGDLLHGRGACDAKGQVVMILAAFRLLRMLRDRFGLRLRSDVGAQFVIDEETGGNGSLSLALQDPFPFDGLVICEPTGLRVYAANRGALWYRARLTAPPGRIAELAAAFVLALEDEGRAIRAESDHPLFPDRPVPVNPGRLGPFGTAPSAVCDRVDLQVAAPGLDPVEIHRAAARAVDRYAALHGDKIAEHVTVHAADDGAFRIEVHGIAGHMGSLDACDNAITKSAFVIRELAALRATGADVEIALTGHTEDTVVVEGGQGFLPTHTIGQIADRLRAAAERCAAAFTDGPASVDLAFDRLHNEAFAREPDSVLATCAVASCRRAGIDVPGPPGGWSASCDARLFAHRFPDRDVIVFGAGRLRHAHAPDERNSLQELAAGAKMLAFLILEAAGFVA